MGPRTPRRVFTASVLIVAALALGQAGTVAAQGTPFVPYFGKNNIHYDKFDWQIYTTDHFEIYYYPEEAKQLERVAGYAESAYQQISADLKHDLPFKVQLILFKTHSEFEQENVDPGAAQEGVGAFAEPYRNRMLVPLDDPADVLYGLITHELTHQFQFDIIPQGLIRRNLPLWVDEGHAEYERGQWSSTDLMEVRDAAVADIVPKMSEMEGYGDSGNALLVYNLGHAVFEFIEAKFGKEGIRQFLFALRKSVIGGGNEDAYEEALKMKKDEFDQAFERYLKDRFKPFRDKERPADYGRDLAPDKEKTDFAEAFAIAPSPSGDLLATVTINRKDRELDIVLISTKDGSIVRNLTEGFDKDMGFDHIIERGERTNVMPWMGWSPKGDRLAYFVRTEKERTLIIQNVLSRNIEMRIPMKTVDEPESPSFSPDGKTIAFAGLRNTVGDIFSLDLASGTITNLTNDEFDDYGPAYSPDGKFIVYNTRVSGNQKLFRLDLDTKKKTQITFGTQDETGAQFIDNHTLVFSSAATDPTIPLDPEVAKNGNILNIWTLDMNNGELRQYTDVLGGNWSPVVLNEGADNKRIAFISYYKGEFSIHTLDRKEPLHTAVTADFGAPGPIIDFQAPLQHTLVTANERKKKMFEKMFLEGRPPVNVGVTSNGDVFGGSQVSFGDVLGDQQFNVEVASISQYRTLAASYVNLSRRFQYALQGFSQTEFFYGTSGTFYNSAYATLVPRSQALATRSVRGGTAFGIYPFDRYRRVELSGGVVQLNEEFDDPALQELAAENIPQNGQAGVFRNGTMVPFGVAFVEETTVFREFGPLAGNTMKLSYSIAPKISSTLSRQTLDGDARHYTRIGSNGLLAMRIRAFKSFGDYPDFIYFGGNSEMHGYDYLSFAGQKVAFADAELRFPLIEAALTPIGMIGGIRGVFFANVGGGWFDNQQDSCTGQAGGGFQFMARKQETCTAVLGTVNDPLTGLPEVDPNNPTLPLLNTVQKTVSGLRLKDARGSYGVGLETFLLGFPLHFDWSWRTLLNKDWEDVVFASQGGSTAFRKPQFAVWIGYDF